MTVTPRLMLATAILGTACAAPAVAQSPVGVWLDDTGRGAVEIVECGQGKLCGKLVWIKNSKNSKACGTPILGEVGKVGGSWDGGWIYSPEKDAKYDVELTPSGTDKLIVLGYAGSKLFSKEMTWTRAPANLQRCDQPQVEAKAATPKEATPPAVAANAGASTMRPNAAPPPKSGGAQMAAVPQAAAPQPVEPAAPAAKTAEQEKLDAEKWASEPEREGPVETAQVDVAPETADKPEAAKAEPTKPRAKTVSRKKKMCSVEAPFVTVDFPCDDD
ncbi:MAG: DUF2147 domain-containing protein [Hyphomicrobiaceae bacterium]|nr:DUF2147 domain-containing protein [Hyphomicrobiaceae bacterium]